jgi:anti-sigma factor (TIGR02949 family)
MSLADVRPECSDIAALLQPFVDGELEDQEAQRVALHLEDCRGCRGAVAEQAWVRGVLRDLGRDAAPQGLQARVLLALDEVDAEERRAARPPGAVRGLWARLGAVARGGALMIPAAAAASVLFFLARQGALPGDPASHELMEVAGVAGAPSDAGLLHALGALEPQVGFPVQVASRSRDVARHVELVGARLQPGDAGSAGMIAPPGARLEYRLVGVDGQPTGHRVVDLQRPTPTGEVPGTRHVFRGVTYYLLRDAGGRPYVSFASGAVTHVVSLEGPGPLPAPTHEELALQEPDFAALLLIADELRASTRAR